MAFPDLLIAACDEAGISPDRRVPELLARLAQAGVELSRGAPYPWFRSREHPHSSRPPTQVLATLVKVLGCSDERAGELLRAVVEEGDTSASCVDAPSPGPVANTRAEACDAEEVI